MNKIQELVNDLNQALHIKTIEQIFKSVLFLKIAQKETIIVTESGRILQFNVERDADLVKSIRIKDLVTKTTLTIKWIYKYHIGGDDCYAEKEYYTTMQVSYQFPDQKNLNIQYYSFEIGKYESPNTVFSNHKFIIREITYTDERRSTIIKPNDHTIDYLNSKNGHSLININYGSNDTTVQVDDYQFDLATSDQMPINSSKRFGMSYKKLLTIDAQGEINRINELVKKGINPSIKNLVKSDGLTRELYQIKDIQEDFADVRPIFFNDFQHTMVTNNDYLRNQAFSQETLQEIIHIIESLGLKKPTEPDEPIALNNKTRRRKK